METEIQRYRDDQVIARLNNSRDSASSPFLMKPTWYQENQLEGYIGKYYFDHYYLKKSSLIVWRYQGFYYRPADLVKIAHQKGNKELTESMLKNRLVNVSDGNEVPETILTTPKKKLFNPGEVRLNYDGKSLSFNEVAEIAKHNGNPLPERTLTHRLKLGWSVYRAVTTPNNPSKLTPEQKLQLQYNQIADLVEKYGREKGLDIWLGKGQLRKKEE